MFRYIVFELYFFIRYFFIPLLKLIRRKEKVIITFGSLWVGSLSTIYYKWFNNSRSVSPEDYGLSYKIVVSPLI